MQDVFESPAGWSIYFKILIAELRKYCNLHVKSPRASHLCNEGVEKDAVRTLFQILTSCYLMILSSTCGLQNSIADMMNIPFQVEVLGCFPPALYQTVGAASTCRQDDWMEDDSPNFVQGLRRDMNLSPKMSERTDVVDFLLFLISMPSPLSSKALSHAYFVGFTLHTQVGSHSTKYSNHVSH